MKKEVYKLLIGWVENGESLETTAERIVDLFESNACVHPVKYCVYCEDDTMWYCKKCDQYV